MVNVICDPVVWERHRRAAREAGGLLIRGMLERADGVVNVSAERIERLEEEKSALSADIREIYSEAKGVGFDTKIMRQVVRLRKLDRADRQEQEAILDLYLAALGMQS